MKIHHLYYHVKPVAINTVQANQPIVWQHNAATGQELQKKREKSFLSVTNCGCWYQTDRRKCFSNC